MKTDPETPGSPTPTMPAPPVPLTQAQKDRRRRRRKLIVVGAVAGAMLLITLAVVGALTTRSGNNDSAIFDSAETSIASDGEFGASEPAFAPTTTIPGDPAMSESGVAMDEFIEPGPIPPPDIGVQGSESGELIKTGNMTIAVTDLQEATTGGKATVEGLGGFVAAMNVQNTTAAPTATATYRVPPAQFDTAVEQISELGTVESQVASVDDVAPEIADLDSRLDTLDTSINRLRGFLAETTDPNAIGNLEGELTRREAEAASLRAQRKALESQVEMATLDVTYTAREPVAPVEPEDTTGGFMGGLEKGWDAAVATASAVAAGFGFLLPFLPVLALAALLVWFLRRRAQRRANT